MTFDRNGRSRIAAGLPTLSDCKQKQTARSHRECEADRVKLTRVGNVVQEATQSVKVIH